MPSVFRDNPSVRHESCLSFVNGQRETNRLLIDTIGVETSVAREFWNTSKTACMNGMAPLNKPLYILEQATIAH